KGLVRLMAAVFGAPADLLAEGAVSRREGALIRSWLEALEGIARALLLAMAARLPRSAPSRGGRRPPRRKVGAPDTALADGESRPDALPDDELPDSERWAGVVFRALSPTAARRKPAAE